MEVTVDEPQGFLTDDELDNVERWARHALRGILGLQAAAWILRLVEEVRVRRSPAKAAAAALLGGPKDPLTEDELGRLVEAGTDNEHRWLANRAVAEIKGLRRRPS